MPIEHLTTKFSHQDTPPQIESKSRRTGPISTRRTYHKTFDMSQGGTHHLWVGVEGGMGGLVGGIFFCQIYIGCSETKLLLCHKGGFIIYGWGWWWGGSGVD